MMEGGFNGNNTKNEVWNDKKEQELSTILIQIKELEKQKEILLSQRNSGISQDVKTQEKSFVQNNETLVKNENSIESMKEYYMPFPGEGFFWDVKKSEKFTDESAYTLKLTSPTTAKINFVDKIERRNNGTKNFTRYLASVCEFLSSPTNAKGFEVVQEGEAEKRGYKWVVDEDKRMKIEFFY